MENYCGRNAAAEDGENEKPYESVDIEAPKASRGWSLGGGILSPADYGV